jgi:hypothetical protein
VSDYRGFDDKEGWRHGVAHGSDWLMQLALNPALDRGQLDQMLAAIATQVCRLRRMRMSMANRGASRAR